MDLLEDGADINACSKGGHTPLIVACTLGSHRIVQLLLREKADPMVSDAHGWSPLHEAARGNRKDLVQLLLNATPLPESIAEMADEVSNGLREEEWYLRRAAAEVLGNFGPAADDQVPEIVALLGKRERDWRVKVAACQALTEFSPKVLLQYQSELSGAAEDKKFEVAKAAQIISKKIEEIADEEDKKKIYEDEEGDAEKAEEPEEKKEDDGEVDEAEFLRIGEECRAMRRIVLINSQNKWGSTPFHEAAEGGFEDIIGFMILLKAELDNRLRDGTTALMMAAKAGDYETCDVLLEKKISVCEQGCAGECRVGHHTPIFNGEKKSAMTLASERTRQDPKYIDVVRLLRSHGLK